MKQVQHVDALSQYPGMFITYELTHKIIRAQKNDKNIKKPKKSFAGWEN